MIDQSSSLSPAPTPPQELQRLKRTAARRRPLWMAYVLAALLTLATLLVRLVMGFTAGDPPLLILFMFPIVVSAYVGGFGPGLLATMLATLLSNYVLLPPQYAFSLTTRFTLLQSSGLIGAGILISVLSEGLHRARRQAESTRRLQAITLASIGDAVITTNVHGQITFLNPEAERLTNWSSAEAVGQPLAVVFRPIDTHTRAPIDDPVARVLHGGAVVGQANATVLIGRDGSETPIDATVTSIRQGGATSEGVVLVFRDVTGREQAEAALHESEDRYRQIVETAQEGIWQIDAANRTTFVNARMAAILGYTVDEMIGAALFDFMDAEGQAIAAANVERRRQGIAEQHDFKFRRKDGAAVWVLISTNPVLDNAGTYAGALAMVTDITARRRDEQALRQSEARFATAFRASPVAMSITSLLDGRFIDINTSHERLFGYPREELIGQSADGISIYADPNQRAEVVQSISAHGSLRETELTLRTKSGELREVLCSLERIEADGEACILGSVFDITARKRAEAALRASEERFRQVFMANPSPKLITRRDNRAIVDANPAFARMTGYARDELVGQTTDALGLWPESEVVAQTRAHLYHAGAVTNREIPIQTRDGSMRELLLSIVPINLDGMAGFLTVMLDQTERKRAERALQRQRERLQHLRMIDQSILVGHSLSEIAEAAVIDIGQLIPSTRVALVLVDAATATISLFALQLRGALQAAPSLHAPLQILGDALAPLTQGQVYAIADLAALPDIPPALRAAQVEGVRAYFYTPVLAGDELIAILNIGSEQPGTFTAEHLAIAREVADQLSIAIQQARLREAVTRHAQELEERVAGRTAELTAANKELEAFSYSVSHDLRAPLRAIDGFTRILLDEYAADFSEEAQHYFQLVRDNAQRMGQLVDDLLAFSRLSRQPLATRTVDSAALVRQCLQELQPEQADRQLTLRVGELPACQGDPALLKQVWFNLIANALKYTRRREDAAIAIGCQVEGAETIFSVKDNGVGFDMRYSDKLFGVFQRLHRAEDYEGTGVGLAIVQRIIHRHGGRIWAEAAPNQGATFYFTLGGKPS